MTEAASDRGAPQPGPPAKSGRKRSGKRRGGSKAGARSRESSRPTTADDGLPHDIPQYLDGTFRTATVTSVESDKVRVSLTDVAEAEVPSEEFAEPPAVGDRFSVFVDTTVRGDPRRYFASIEKAQRVAPYNALASAFDKGTPVEGEVVSAIEGGFDVDVMGIRAFLPASQVGLRPVRNQFEVLGHRFNFKVIRFNRSRYNVVLSRKVLLGAERASRPSNACAKARSSTAWSAASSISVRSSTWGPSKVSCT